MSNKRDLRLKQYEISKKRYKELCGFCEQYPEWIGELAFNDGRPGSPVISDMLLAPHSNESKVEKIALRNYKLSKKVDVVQKCAKKASEEFWQFIIWSVCYEFSVTALINIRGMALSKSEFYRKRRIFFYLLDKELD